MRGKAKAKQLIIEQIGCQKVVPSSAFPGFSWSQRWADTPMHVDVGMGSGGFLQQLRDHHLRQGELCTYVGIEVKEERIMQAVRKNTDPSVCFVWGTAQGIDGYFPPGSVGAVYLNCSDPWSKLGDTTKRLTHPDYLRLYRAILRPDGMLHIKTDDQGFWDYSRQMLQDDGWQIEVDLPHYTESDHWMVGLQTEYEQMHCSAGKSIHYLQARYVAA